jgi:LSD1 subclass zinc finger protein
VGKSVRCPHCKAVFVAQAAPAEHVPIDCSHCGKVLKVPADALGKKVRCPLCQAVIVARTREEPEPVVEEGIVVVEDVPPPLPPIPDVIPVGPAAPRPAVRPRPGARPRERAGAGTALPWILGGVGGAVFLVALVVVVILLARSGSEPADGPPADFGQAEGKGAWDKKAPGFPQWEEKKGPWGDKQFDQKPEANEKAAPPRIPFGDAHAQRIALKGGKFQTEGRPEDTDVLDRDGVRAAKLYLVKLEAGRVYLIEMKPLGGGFQRPQLRLEDTAGREVAAGKEPRFDGHAQLLSLPPQTATYRVVVSAHAPKVGPFTLSLREIEDGDPLPEGNLPKQEVPKHSIQVAKKLDQYMAAAIAPDSKSAWVAFQGGKLQHFSCPAFEILGTYRLPKEAYQLVLDGRGTLYAMVSRTEKQAGRVSWRDFGAADLHFYDTRKLPGDGGVLTPTKVIPLGGIVQHLIVSPDDAWLYFLDTHNRKVGRIDLKEGKLAGENDQITAGSVALCLTPNGKTLYSCSNTNVVQQIDPATLKIEKTITLDRGNPRGIQANDSGYVFLNSGEGQWTHVYLLNAKRDYKGATAKVLPWAGVYSLSSLRLSPDQKRLYTSCFNLSPANIASYYITERPALFKGQQSGAVGIDANFAARGLMEVSPDGTFMFCDRGLILLLGR